MSTTDKSMDENTSRLGLTATALERINKRRRMIDIVSSAGIKLGGVSVILAVCLIFFYLLYEVIPLMESASIEQKSQYELKQSDAATYFLAVEEQNEVGMRFLSNGVVEFYRVHTGDIIAKESLLLSGQQIKSVALNSRASHLIAVGLEDGTVVLFKHQYKETYLESKRVVIPFIEYPYGDEPIEVAFSGDAIKNLAVRDTDTDLILVAETDQAIYYKRFEKEENFVDESVFLEEAGSKQLPLPSFSTKKLLIEPETRWLYVIQDKSIEVYDLKADEEVKQDIINLKTKITSAEFLLGGISLLIGDKSGTVSQYFPVRDEDQTYRLTAIRQFKFSDSPIVAIEPEQRRKGFVALDATGKVGFFNATAQSEIFSSTLTHKPIDRIVLGPRANSLILFHKDNTVTFYDVDNKFPEVSLSVLWQQVWYESYPAPDYVWQSSSASNDFEAKLSLVPLAFGTLKAAFYAMLFAMPLAICGAIYTAQFMSAGLRTKVKPTIELMEALPTVILGFLAGLWLAPFMEENLPGIFAVMFVLPVSILLFGFCWQQLPINIRAIIPEGWLPILLTPVIILTVLLAMEMSDSMQNWFFDGDMRAWLTNKIGIDFDQRNALVVGLAMGFAVIPTIFSIAEDALFAVPKHLSQGSLALGATPWQTLVRVVLPTASPGIFSGVMIGFGRAVGETMIVLMATGNTPIMDINIFEGLRTLSANIAVEMPEAEVDSSHYRILFLTALVLFVFTFIFNTTAELVRQRLRDKYGSL